MTPTKVMTVDTTPASAAMHSARRRGVMVLVGFFSAGLIGTMLVAGAADAEPTHATARELAPSHTHVVRRARVAKAPRPQARRPVETAPAPVAMPTTVWTPEGFVLGRAELSDLTWGCALERWHVRDKVRIVSMGPAFEAIRAHYGTYHRAMLVLTGKDLPQ